MVAGDRVTPAETIAQRVRRKAVDAGGSFASSPSRAERRRIRRVFLRKSQHLRAKGLHPKRVVALANRAALAWAGKARATSHAVGRGAGKRGAA